MEQKEFTIEALPNSKFRTAKIPPMELLALTTTQFELNDFEKTKVLFTYAIEHTETKSGENWVPVKQHEKELYFPIGLEENMTALNQIVVHFITEVIGKTFTKSNG